MPVARVEPNLQLRGNSLPVTAAVETNLRGSGEALSLARHRAVQRHCGPGKWILEADEAGTEPGDAWTEVGMGRTQGRRVIGVDTLRTSDLGPSREDFGDAPSRAIVVRMV